MEKLKSDLKKSLGKNPNDIEALHQLAFIYMQQNLFDDAKKTFDRALALAPNSVFLLNHYGLLLYRQKKFADAEKQFRKALEHQQDYIDAMINLGLTLIAQTKEEEGIACLLTVIKAQPKNLRAHFELGKFFLAKKLSHDANEEFLKIIELEQNDPDILTSIIKEWLIHKHFSEAKIYCEKLLKMQPKNIEVIYNLAVIETKLNEKENAINHYLLILQLKPDYFPALNNLAVLYLENHNLDAAKYYFKQALKLQPDNEAIQYTLNAIEGKMPLDKAPKTYVQNLFDAYADHFDVHVRKALQYKVPELLFDAVSHATDKKDLIILDLGCGTGLCGEVFKTRAQKLVGVDLSPKMIEAAQQKNIYGELVVAENLEYLRLKKNVFDLILAADVLVYVGNLRSILTACFDALKQNGLLAFSTEVCEKQDFAMQPSGRFCHSQNYIEDLAKKIGFKILSHKICPTRLQQDKEVLGNIFVLRK
ncbi:MAG: tetratricopeptide repeat protein [Gammaproteobacteria bacterium]